MISIIIRTKNEERWIVHCLQKILNQTIKDFEIILVDNKSTDRTIEKAKAVYPDIKIVEIEKYLPGYALNAGIRASKGEYIVCLSAHCLPAREDWLEQFLANFKDSKVAGVYGRQIPMKFTSPSDKRDLLVTFGLDKRVHKRDSFFHNANSMISRAVWEKHPFDEKATNIEDRIWGKEVIEAGYNLIYEPEAPVYHYHGIHQNNDQKRCEGVVNILDELEFSSTEKDKDPLTPDQLEVVAIIPLREGGIDENEELVLKTINAALEAKHINRVIISTGSEKIARNAKKWGVSAPFLRPKELSSEQARVDEVLTFSLSQLESDGYFPDLVVPLELTYPFRSQGLLDKLIEQILIKGMDTIIAGVAEYRPCWIERNQNLERVDNFNQPRQERKPILIGLPSLGCVTFPEFIRLGTRLGDKVGIYEVKDLRASIEVRSISDFQRISNWL